MASPNAPVQMQAADWLELQGLLASIEPGWQVLAFGSRARFQAKPHSDLDLAIVAPQALSLAWPFSATTSTRRPGGLGARVKKATPATPLDACEQS